MSSSVPPEDQQEQEQHEEDQQEQEQQEQRWVPTHVQVTVLRGRGLRGKGRQGTSDVYTIIQVGREKYCTCVAERTTSPEWQEECSFELQPGALQEDDLVLTVMHRAAIGLDVFLGQAVIPLEKAFQDNVSAKNQTGDTLGVGVLQLVICGGGGGGGVAVYRTGDTLREEEEEEVEVVVGGMSGLALCSFSSVTCNH
ncbi:hypothetical protein CRUP_016398 [Coryphaenoides rupestris]|nr:hypothetical protein CRUP_016398 [Coryphaenoides rupestris]